MASWRFLTNHALVLAYIGRYPDSTGLEIAQAVGITERAARKIVAELLVDGYTERERHGRRNRYRLNTQLPLRHPAERDATVGELLEVLWREDSPRRISPTRAPITARQDDNGASANTGTARLHSPETRRTVRA